MIRQLRYVNSRGDEVVFAGGSGPYHFGQLDIFDTERDYRSVGSTITSFTDGIRELSLAVVMREGSAEHHNRLEDVLSYDVRTGQPGTLWAGDSYMRCWIPKRRLSDWMHYDSYCVWDCTVVTDRPHWVRTVEFELYARDDLDRGGLNYPHDYPHNYLYSAGASQVIRNPFMLPCACDIAFAGPCVQPYVIIGGNRYQVRSTVEAGQLLLVRGYGGKDIAIRHSDGTERSAFAQGVREPGANIFAEVPVGDSVASWSGSYNVSVTLYEERTTPWWT